MIELYTIAGPVAQLRTMMTPLAAELPPRERLIPPDPAAPTGPRPSFEATPLERLREMPPVDVMRRTDPVGRPRGATCTAPSGTGCGAGSTPGDRVAHRLDRLV